MFPKCVTYAFQMENVQKSVEADPMGTTFVERSPIQSVSVQSGAHVSTGSCHSCNDCPNQRTLENTMLLQSTLRSKRKNQLRVKKKQNLLRLVRLSRTILQKVKVLNKITKVMVDEDDKDNSLA